MCHFWLPQTFAIAYLLCISILFLNILSARPLVYDVGALQILHSESQRERFAISSSGGLLYVPFLTSPDLRDCLSPSHFNIVPWHFDRVSIGIRCRSPPNIMLWIIEGAVCHWFKWLVVVFAISDLPKPSRLLISFAFQYYSLIFWPRVHWYMMLKPSKYYALNHRGSGSPLVQVVGCCICHFWPSQTFAIAYLLCILILFLDILTACPLVYDVEALQILCSESQRERFGIGSSGWLLCVPFLASPNLRDCLSPSHFNIIP